MSNYRETARRLAGALDDVGLVVYGADSWRVPVDAYELDVEASGCFGTVWVGRSEDGPALADGASRGPRGGQAPEPDHDYPGMRLGEHHDPIAWIAAREDIARAVDAARAWALVRAQPLSPAVEFARALLCGDDAERVRRASPEAWDRIANWHLVWRARTALDAAVLAEGARMLLDGEALGGAVGQRRFREVAAGRALRVAGRRYAASAHAGLSGWDAEAAQGAVHDALRGAGLELLARQDEALGYGAEIIGRRPPGASIADALAGEDAGSPEWVAAAWRTRASGEERTAVRLAGAADAVLHIERREQAAALVIGSLADGSAWLRVTALQRELRALGASEEACRPYRDQGEMIREARAWFEADGTVRARMAPSGTGDNR